MPSTTLIELETKYNRIRENNPLAGGESFFVVKPVKSHTPNGISSEYYSFRDYCWVTQPTLECFTHIRDLAAEIVKDNINDGAYYQQHGSEEQQRGYKEPQHYLEDGDNAKIVVEEHLQWLRNKGNRDTVAKAIEIYIQQLKDETLKNNLQSGKRWLVVRETTDGKQYWNFYINDWHKELTEFSSTYTYSLCQNVLHRWPDAQIVEHDINSKFSSLQKQHGGIHYKGMTIEPAEYIHKNQIGFLAGNAIKYISRYKSKNAKEDILKAIHYLEMILDMEYNTSLEKEKGN